MLVQNLHWIVVEDSDHKTALVSSLLTETRLNYTHLYEPTPAEWKHKPKVSVLVGDYGIDSTNNATIVGTISLLIDIHCLKSYMFYKSLLIIFVRIATAGL